MNRNLFVLLWLGIASVCFIKVYRSVASGVIHLQGCDVRRAETPLIFWTLIGLFMALGLLILDPGLFLWIIARI